MGKQNTSKTKTMKTDEITLAIAAAALGRKGGKSKSAKKAAAVRRNGKLGGRPVRLDEQNLLNVERATQDEIGTWVLHLAGRNVRWLSLARAMIEALAEREGTSTTELDVCVMLPEKGRTFTKAGGSDEIVAHG